MNRTFSAALLALVAITEVAWAQQQQRSPMLIVRNASPNQNGAILLSVYAVPSNQQGNWGNDLLGSIVVGTGSTIGIFVTPGSCVFDVRVVFDNNFSAERRSVNVCSNEPWNSVVEINGGTFTTARGNTR